MKPGNYRALLDLLTTVAILVTCGVVVAANWSKIWPTAGPQLPGEALSLEGATLKGDPRAPIVLIAWSDYQCPYCVRAERELLPIIEANYVKTGRVQLAFRHNPLTPIHPQAAKAAEAALCAGRQGRFWEMHAELFRDNKDLEQRFLTGRATALGLDVAQFTSCMRGGATANVVDDDIKAATTLGLRSTPAFLVGRRQTDGRVKATAVLVGAGTLDKLVEAFEQTESNNRSSLQWLGALLIAVAAAGLLIYRRRRLRARTPVRAVIGSTAEIQSSVGQSGP